MYSNLGKGEDLRGKASQTCVHKSPWVLSECRSDLGLGWACCYMSNKLPGDDTARVAGLGTTLGVRGEHRPRLGA